MIAVSLDGKMVNVCVFIPTFRRNFFGQESHRPFKSEDARTPMLHTYQRASDAQKEIVSDVLQGSATDFSGASVESDEPPTKKIREYAPKENTALFNFRN